MAHPAPSIDAVIEKVRIASRDRMFFDEASVPLVADLVRLQRAA